MIKSWLITTVSVVVMATAPLAASESPKPQQQFNSTALWFENWDGMKNATLNVVFPDGRYETIESRTGTPVFKLVGAEIPDGVYRFELSAATNQTEKIKNPMNNGRGEAQRSERAVPFYMNGHFIVERGVIVANEDTTKEE